MMLPTFEEIMRQYDLRPHPEGGFYRRTYRSADRIPAGALPSEFGSDRPCSTAIYFLLGLNDMSRLHRIRQDETWHFYLGGPLRLVMLDDTGRFTEVTLGPHIQNGQEVQYTVPKGCWFGARPLPESPYAFVGCTVAPGFDFADLEIGRRDELIRLYPARRQIIAEFTTWLS